MTDRIEKITQKIYNEGVSKAKNDAEQLIAEAKKQADEIISSAKKNYEQIMQDAQKKSAELQKKTEAEMQLTARQFINKLKQKVTELVTTAQVEGSIKESFNDIDFVQELILTVLQNWNATRSEKLDLKVVLPKQQEQQMTTFFDQKAKETLNKGISIDFDSQLGSGFRIEQKEEGYRISFTGDDFENYFKNYFKDRTKKLLFDQVGKE